DVADEAHGLTRVVVFDVIPSVDDLESAGEMPFGLREAGTEMVVGDGPGKQNRARVVPVAIALDHFGARAGDELTEIHLEAAVLALGLPAHEGLFDVLGSQSRFAAVDDIEG